MGNEPSNAFEEAAQGVLPGRAVGPGADSAWFPAFSELQLRVDGVNAMLHRRDAVDVAVRK